MYIAIDFDGTIVEHRFPDIGREIPEAFNYMKKFQEAGAKLVLNTMRSDNQQCGNVLTEAVEYCKARGIEFYGINHNPDQDSWTSSNKVYAKYYIDDAAIGCPLRESSRMGARPFVDWEIVGPMVMEKITKNV